LPPHILPILDPHKESFAEDENFIFLEAGRMKFNLLTGNFFPKIANGQFLDNNR